MAPVTRESRENKVKVRGRQIWVIAVLLACLFDTVVVASAEAQGYAVGTFIKSTATGNQTITHTLGSTPVAIIFFTGGAPQVAQTYTYNRIGIGFSDGTTSRSIGWYETGNSSPSSNTSHRYANRLLTSVSVSESVPYECDYVSGTATTFTVNWTTNSATPDQINYIVVGGAGIQAKVLEWIVPTVVGNKAVTGTGFAPKVVFHIYNDDRGGSFQNLAYGFGAMTANGQFAVGGQSNDNAAPDGGHDCQTGSYALLKCAGTVVQYEAKYVSLDASGFTVNFDKVDTVANTFAASLSIGGLANASIGRFVKTTSAAPA